MNTTTAVHNFIINQMNKAICKLPKQWKTNSKSKINLQSKNIFFSFLSYLCSYRPFRTRSLIVTCMTSINSTATKTFLILRTCEVWNRSVRMEFRAMNWRDSVIWRVDDLNEYCCHTGMKSKIDTLWWFNFSAFRMS